LSEKTIIRRSSESVPSSTGSPLRSSRSISAPSSIALTVLAAG
jgi:hypothetical protein